MIIPIEINAKTVGANVNFTILDENEIEITSIVVEHEGSKANLLPLLGIIRDDLVEAIIDKLIRENGQD